MPHAWYNLGVAYINLNRYNDAIEAYRQALRINPEDADAWNNLGIAYRHLNRYNDAIEAYRQALRINPEYAAAWYNLGVAYCHFRQPDSRPGSRPGTATPRSGKADKLFNLIVPR